MGLLDTFLGNADQTQALGLLGAHMMQGNAAGGFQAASGLLADAPKRRMQQQLLEAQIAETLAQADERKQIAAKRQSDMQEAARVRGLVQNFGLPRPGAGATDQVNAALPAEMRIGAQPQMPGAVNNDYQSLIRGGVPLETVKALAESQNFGRPKATRQMEVDDGKGGKRIALVDDFGQEVAGFAGYTPPVQVNRGDRVDFVKPAPGLSLGINMSPEARDASARGWATVNQGAQRLAMEQNAPKGQYDGERGLIIDSRTGEARPVTQAGQPIGPKQEKLGETAKKQIVGIDALGGAVDEYVKELGNFGLSSLARPDKRAGMGTKYNNMMLQAKEAYNLGVLNGPDYDILTAIVTDPTSLKGAITSNEAMARQAEELKRIMGKVRSAVAAQGKPAGGSEVSGTAQTPGASGTSKPVQWRYVDGKMVKVQ